MVVVSLKLLVDFFDDERKVLASWVEAIVLEEVSVGATLEPVFDVLPLIVVVFAFVTPLFFVVAVVAVVVDVDSVSIDDRVVGDVSIISFGDERFSKIGVTDDDVVSSLPIGAETSGETGFDTVLPSLLPLSSLSLISMLLLVLLVAMIALLLFDEIVEETSWWPSFPVTDIVCFPLTILRTSVCD